MKIAGVEYVTIWPSADGATVDIIDQTKLPHALEIVSLRSASEAARAITSMQVRGAPLIGITAAYGIYLGLRADPSDENLAATSAMLAATRPTAVNLRWALAEMNHAVKGVARSGRADTAFARARELGGGDVESCRAIGEWGKPLISSLAAKTGRRVNILTHCNAGWLAAVDWGTALSPIYQAYNDGVPVHVWVDETRPRNQGAALTAFELGAHGVPHTIIADNAGGHLMQHGKVDICIVGCDRLAANGDAANKIGTYLKALAAHDNGVPFYVALPYSTIDWTIADGVAGIPIEERDAREMTHISGALPTGAVVTVQVSAPGSPAANPAFDVTPARLITGIITEKGIAAATERGLLGLYPERAAHARAA